MADSAEPFKLSTFVASIVDRKVKSFGLAITAVVKQIKTQTTETTKLKAFRNRFGRGANHYGSWEIRPGIIEMWGRHSGTPARETAQQVVFPLALPNTTFNVNATAIIASNSGLKDIGVQIVEASRDVNSVSLYFQSSTSDAAQLLDGFDWRIICAVDFAYAAVENTTTPPTGTGDNSGATKVTVLQSKAPDPA